MTRGFLAEGLVVTALVKALGERVLAHAPTFAPRYVDVLNHHVHAGHPDILVIGDEGLPELIQVKCPSVAKWKRIEQYGDEEALETYRSQMIEEMFITRQSSYVDEDAGLTVVRNNLVVFSWDHTGKDTKPKTHVVPLDWHESMLGIPLAMADEIEEDVAAALAMNVWPEPYAEHRWNTWPCAYCMYSRLGEYLEEKTVIPKCDDHEAWK